MRYSGKPVHKCYSCLLNQGDQCWGFRFPGQQWRARRRCAAFENEAIYRQFNDWLKDATVKRRKELRQEALRKHKPEPIYHLEPPPGQDAGR